MLIVNIKTDGNVPARSHVDDAGFDLCANERVTLDPGCHVLVPTGVCFELPEGVVGMVCPRSGLAAKHGVTVLNSPGVVDAGYTGEVFVNLYNAGAQRFTANKGDRIAQLVPIRVEPIELNVVDVLGETERGANGHGSTGC